MFWVYSTLTLTLYARLSVLSIQEHTYKCLGFHFSLCLEISSQISTRIASLPLLCFWSNVTVAGRITALKDAQVLSLENGRILGYMAKGN